MSKKDYVDSSEYLGYKDEIRQLLDKYDGIYLINGEKEYNEVKRYTQVFVDFINNHKDLSEKVITELLFDFTDSWTVHKVLERPLIKKGLKEKLNGSLLPVPSNFKISTLKTFDKAFKKLGLDDKDLIELKDELTKRPPKSSLGSNIYKFEWSPSKWSTGSRDGSRVIYIQYIKGEIIFLATIYRKSDKVDLTQDEQKFLRRLGKELTK